MRGGAFALSLGAVRNAACAIEEAKFPLECGLKAAQLFNWPYSP